MNNMKFMISYFYMIRFFKPNMIPISTALYDPKWFHKDGDTSSYYLDKNNVICGLRYPQLNPDPHCDCAELAGSCDKTAKNCNFIKSYYEKISKIDFNDMLRKFNIISTYVQTLNNYTQDPVIILIVHEKPDNPCSERSSLVRLFKEHGIELKEFEKCMT